jgi:hypothetical protein
MFQHPTTNAMLVDAHQGDMRRKARDGRLARQSTHGDAPPQARINPQLVGMLVSLLVILGAISFA